MLPSGESWRVCQRDRWTDGWTPDSYIMLSAKRGEHSEALNVVGFLNPCCCSHAQYSGAASSEHTERCLQLSQQISAHNHDVQQRM